MIFLFFWGVIFAFHRSVVIFLWVFFGLFSFFFLFSQIFRSLPAGYNISKQVLDQYLTLLADDPVRDAPPVPFAAPTPRPHLITHRGGGC